MPPLGHRRLGRPQAARHGVVRGVGTGEYHACSEGDRAIAPGALPHLTQLDALRVGDHNFGSWSSDLGHVPLDHNSGISPRDFTSRGLAVRGQRSLSDEPTGNSSKP